LSIKDDNQVAGMRGGAPLLPPAAEAQLSHLLEIAPVDRDMSAAQRTEPTDHGE
jgi:hypothetical protein